MADPALRRATYEDLFALPAHVVGEILDGELVVSPRPGLAHGAAASALGEELGPPFKRGRGGPGGWVILDEPELHLRDDIVVPDLAGWRRERMPEIPETAACSLAPDWVAEVASPKTAAIDRTVKLDIYAREQVSHVWIVDAGAKLLEVFVLDGPGYRRVAAWAGDAKVRAVPFDAIELDLALLWSR